MRFQLFSQTFSVVGVDSTSASLGGAEFRPLVCQKTTVTRTQLFRSGWCCFSGCRCCLRMKSVRHLLMKYCLPFRPDDRYRKFADYVVDHYIDPGCDFAPDLRASSPQQSPTTTNTAESFHSHLNADIKTPHPNIGLFNRSYVNRPLPTGTY